MLAGHGMASCRLFKVVERLLHSDPLPRKGRDASNNPQWAHTNCSYPLNYKSDDQLNTPPSLREDTLRILTEHEIVEVDIWWQNVNSTFTIDFFNIFYYK